jgi:hypothetical protein
MELDMSMFDIKNYTGADLSSRAGISKAAGDLEEWINSRGRSLTHAERDQAEAAIKAFQDASETITITEQIDAMRSGGTGKSSNEPFGFGSAVAATQFDVKSNPSVDVDPGFLFKSTFPAVTDVNRSTPGIVPQGRDSRWLYPLLPSQQVGDLLSVQDFRQSARTVTGTVERGAIATSDKATLDVTLELVNREVKQAAVLIPGVPLNLFESVDGLRQYLNAEGTFQVQKAIDAHVFSQIVASSPLFGNTGTGLVAQVRNGVAAMRAQGAEPDILVVNPGDAATLDLTSDAGGFVFAVRDSGVSSPLWGLKVVERTSTAGNEPPYLIDSQMLGKLYIGNLRFDADPFSGTGGANFKKNLVDLRVEANVLFHVRNAQGARRIAAA